MGSDLAPLVDRIHVLTHGPANDPPERLLARMEHTLTDGYAHALALEAKSLRIERQIDDAVARLGKGEDADELGALTDRVAAIRRDLVALRAHLEALRRRTDLVRRSLSPV